MAAQVIVHAVQIATNAGRVFEFVSDPSNLPRWAPQFAPRIEPQNGGRWLVHRDGNEIELRPRSSLEFGVVDFVRDSPDGTIAGAFLKVISYSADACIVTMIVPAAPTADPATVRQVVEGELQNLGRILA